LVDNSVFSFALQVNNGIPILPYYHGSHDEELVHLLYYLDCIVGLEDVRTHNEEAFGLMKLSDMDYEDLMGEINSPGQRCLSDQSPQSKRRQSGLGCSKVEELSEEEDESDGSFSPGSPAGSGESMAVVRGTHY
jgi:hypothetical protein